jgi:hypothetical protein
MKLTVPARQPLRRMRENHARMRGFHALSVVEPWGKPCFSGKFIVGIANAAYVVHIS